MIIYEGFCLLYDMKRYQKSDKEKNNHALNIERVLISQEIM